MKPDRHLEEVVSRVVATFVFYRQDDGQWRQNTLLTSELRSAVAGLEAIEQSVQKTHARFFCVLETELIARYGTPMGQQLATQVRDVLDSEFLQTTRDSV